MSWALTLLGIIALVLLHELGHFAVAKAVGMRVERFSLFFPPILFSVRRGETEYAIGALPLGGYVKIAGMAPVERLPGTPRAEAGSAGAPAPTGVGVLAASANAPTSPPQPPAAPAPDAGLFGDLQGNPDPDDPRGYFRQPVWKRMAVIAAGPAMNVIVAFALLWGVYALSAQTPVNNRARVASVQAGSPAANILRKGDVVLAVEGQPVRFHGETANVGGAVAAHRCAVKQVDGCRASTPVRLTVQRGGQQVVLYAYPQYSAKFGRMLVGFAYGPTYRRDSVIQAMEGSASEMWHVTTRTISTIGKLFVSEHARKEVHSIVGASDITSEAFSLSVPAALFILALLSLTLAIVNLFPFLPLDGGHLFWALAEKVRGRAIPFWVMERASVVGILLVGFVFIIGLTNDINSLSNGSLTIHH
jgi:regulator of sigma E protease